MKKKQSKPEAKQGKASQKTLKLPEQDEPVQPVLRFTPYAWAKLQWFCHHGETEIGGFGVTEPDDLLLIQDFVTVQQKVSSVSVAFDDEAVADLFEEQVDAGRRPEQFARTWCHTHPGDSPSPSGTDEETFSRVFGHCEWAVMFVLAKGGKTYARLRFNVGPKGQVLIPVEIDYTAQFPGSNHDAWQQEYLANIHPEPLTITTANSGVDDGFGWDEPWGVGLDLLEDEEVEQLVEGEIDGFDELLLDEMR